MHFAVDKVLISFGFVLLFTLFISARVGLAANVAYPDRFLQVNEDHSADDSIHYMAKRRFLPTRRELLEAINDDSSAEHDHEASHSYNKRYFLKSKRYFLNSK